MTYSQILSSLNFLLQIIKLILKEKDARPARLGNSQASGSSGLLYILAFIAFIFLLIIGFLIYLLMQKSESEARRMEKYEDFVLNNLKKHNDTECDVIKTAAETSCKMMKKSTEVASDLQECKRKAQAMREEWKTMNMEKEKFQNADGSNVTDSESDINLGGHSSDELFNRPSTDDDSKWVVCGYMKVGQVNLIVAGGGVGKTIIMVQIALAVARGTRPEFLPDECCASVKLPVVYYRLEDFSGELDGKYGNGKVLRDSGITWFLPEDLPEFSLNGFIEHLKSLAETLKEHTLVCIDPATKLYGYGHTVFVKGVEEAMKIAEGRGIFLTPVATIHLDEIKDWAPLSICDIKGGDSAFQKAGSVTALRRERTDLDHRFLQSLKEPKGSPKPFNGNVLVCKAVEEELDENNRYLHYEFECIKEETLARPEKQKAQSNPVFSARSPQPGRTSNNQTLFEEDDLLLKQWKEEGLSNEEIQKRFKAMGKHVSFKTISRHLKKVC